MLIIVCLKLMSFAVYWEIQGLFEGLLCGCTAHFICMKKRTQVHMVTGLPFDVCMMARASPSIGRVIAAKTGEHLCCQGHLSDHLPGPTVTGFCTLSVTVPLLSASQTQQSLIPSSWTKLFTNNSLVKLLQKFTAAVTSWKHLPMCMSTLPFFFTLDLE